MFGFFLSVSYLGRFSHQAAVDKLGYGLPGQMRPMRPLNAATAACIALGKYFWLEKKAAQLVSLLYPRQTIHKTALARG